MAAERLPIPLDLLPELVEAVELRLGGYSYERIAEAQGVSKSTAHRRVQAAMAATLQEPADELRRMELERLDRLFGVMYERAMTNGKDAARAAEMALKTMERRAKMLGLDAPERRTIDVWTHDQFAEAVEALNAEIAELESLDAQTGDPSQPS